MSRLYVASSMLNRPAVQRAIFQLRAAGHEITWDWTYEDASQLTPGSPEYIAFLEECGRKDYLGVASADAVVVLNHPECRDTRTEMGFALGMGKPVLVIDAHVKPSVFFGLCWKVKDVQAVIDFLAPKVPKRTCKGQGCGGCSGCGYLPVSRKKAYALAHEAPTVERPVLTPTEYPWNEREHGDYAFETLVKKFEEGVRPMCKSRRCARPAAPGDNLCDDHSWRRELGSSDI